MVSAVEVSARRRWAFRMVQRCKGPIPPYGSRAWLALSEGDFRKSAAVVIAAEAWARDGDELIEGLRAEVEELRRAHKSAEDADYVTCRDAHREEWRHLSSAKSDSLRQLYSTQGTPRDLYDIGAEHMANLRADGGRST